MSYLAGSGGALGCVRAGREVTRATRQTTPAARRNRRRLDMREVHPRLNGSGTWDRLPACQTDRQASSLPHNRSLWQAPLGFASPLTNYALCALRGREVGTLVPAKGARDMP